MNPTIIQWQSLIRSLGIFLGGIFVSFGLLNQTSVSTLVDQAVAAAPVIINFVAAITPIALTVWGMISHRNTANIAAVKDVPGQGVVVGPAAPPEAIKMAADRSDPKVDFVNPADSIARHL